MKKHIELCKKTESHLSATAKSLNMSLPTSDKKTYENIIQNTYKYNLVVFTASWCSFCIKKIPILKKIQKDLSSNIILSYAGTVIASDPRSCAEYTELKSILEQYLQKE